MGSTLILNIDENKIIRGMKSIDSRGDVSDSMQATFSKEIPQGQLKPDDFSYKIVNNREVRHEIHFGDSHDRAFFMRARAQKPSLHLTEVSDEEFNKPEFKAPEGSQLSAVKYDKAINDSAEVIYELMNKSREPGTGLTSKSSPFPTVNKGGKGLQA